MDNEAAENAQEVIEYCNSLGVITRNFPPYLGHFLNLCDNRVHATVQENVDKLEAHLTHPSPSLHDKYMIFIKAYKNVTPEEVINSLNSIGFGNLRSEKEAEAHFIRTLSEGLPIRGDDHAVQLEAYLNDCIDNGDPLPRSPYNYRLPGVLWDTYFDFLDFEAEVDSEL
jgi:hypothetical protein